MIESAVTRSVPRWAMRIAGVAMLLLALPIDLAVVAMVYRFVVDGPTPSKDGVLLFGLCLLALGVFLTRVGLRLLLLRPNAQGSLLSPGGWMALGVVFAGLQAITLDTTRGQSDVAPGAALIAPALFAAGCFTIAWRLRQRR